MFHLIVIQGLGSDVSVGMLFVTCHSYDDQHDEPHETDPRHAVIDLHEITTATATTTSNDPEFHHHVPPRGPIYAAVTCEKQRYDSAAIMATHNTIAWNEQYVPLSIDRHIYVCRGPFLAKATLHGVVNDV